MKKKKNYRYGIQITSIVSVLAVISFSIWGAVAPLLVYALPPALLKAKTMAELIVTLFAGSGTAFTSPALLNPISAYSTEYYSFESMIENDVLVPVDPNVTKEEAIAALGTGTNTTSPLRLNAQNFRSYIEGNWQGMKDSGLDAVLRLNEIANTDSVYGAIDNLGQIVLDVANYGYLGANNAIAIVANPETVLRVSINTIKDAFLSIFGTNVQFGEPLEGYQAPTVDGKKLVNVINVKYKSGSSTWEERKYLYTAPETPLYYAMYTNSPGSYGYAGIVAYNPNSNRSYFTIKYESSRNPGVVNTINRDLASKGVGGYDSNNSCYYIPATYIPTFATENEARAYLNGLKNENVGVPDIISPDVINQEQGNIYDIDNVQPLISEGEVMDLIPFEDYTDFINDVADNPGEENGLIMDEFMDPYINVVPDYKEPWEDPVVPDVGNMIPAQPTFPSHGDVTPEEKEEALLTSIDGIVSVFPFCIPWDIYGFLKEFKIEREVPVIVWRFQVERFDIDHTFVIDLTEFDDVATLLRLLELILFIVGLALKTRDIIGA